MNDKLIVVTDLEKKEKKLKFKTKDNKPFSITLKKPSVSEKKYIESMLFKKLDDIHEIDYANHLYAERIIRHVIKDIEGVHAKIGGKIKPYKLQFVDNKNERLTKDSYDFIINLFEQHLTQDDAERLFQEYAEMTNGILPNGVKNKDLKKK